MFDVRRSDGLTYSLPLLSASRLRTSMSLNPLRSIVSRSLPLGSTATFAALPAMSLTPVAPFVRWRV
jgi:hypothetical protein